MDSLTVLETWTPESCHFVPISLHKCHCRKGWHIWQKYQIHTIQPFFFLVGQEETSMVQMGSRRVLVLCWLLIKAARRSQQMELIAQFLNRFSCPLDPLLQVPFKSLICAWSCSVLLQVPFKSVICAWSCLVLFLVISQSGYDTLCMKLFSSQFLVNSQSGCHTLICAWSYSVLSFCSSDKVVGFPF